MLIDTIILADALFGRDLYYDIPERLSGAETVYNS